MRLITALAASVLALGASAQSEPITQPFFLTVVFPSGAEQAASIVEVSRGVPILTPWPEYGQLFTYNTTDKRIYAEDKPGLGCDEISTAPFIFTYEEPTGDPALEQLGEDGAMYLIKAGTGEKGAQGWETRPVNETLPTNVFWPGQGAPEANARLRIDLKVPTSRRVV